MACRAAVDRGSPTVQILGDVGSDVTLAQSLHKIAGVVTLVCPERDPSALDRDAVYHLERSQPLGMT